MEFIDWYIESGVMLAVTISCGVLGTIAFFSFTFIKKKS